MANEKRISVDIVVPLSGRGGVENVINRTARYLTGQRFLVRVVQMVYDGPAWLDEEIAFYPLRREKVNDILDFIPMYAQFMQQTYTPELVLATPWPYMALAARKALELSGMSAKVIAWIHGPLEMYKKYEVGGAECLGFADKIFVLNKRTQTMLTKLLPQIPAELVCNPVDFSGCREVEPGNNRCLLFVGRLSPEKNVSLILDAVAASNGWRLRVIGDGVERGALAEQAERLGITEYVEFLGWQSNPWECAQGADAFVLASEYEAFPLAAIEAMACGLPVFSTPVDGVIELVRPGENGFLYAKGDSAELAELLNLYAAGRLPRINAAACRASVRVCEVNTALRKFTHLLKGMCDMISVIIPCYNVSDCLPGCLNSIFGQETNVQIEVICVDDKSTDNTMDVLAAWEARYPDVLTVISLEENGKQGRARNLALQYASGNYVTYVDADDEVLPGYFDRLYETICACGCEVVGCGYRLAIEEQFSDVPIWNEPALFDVEDSTLDMQKYLMFLAWKTSPWGRLYRTDFLRKNNILFAEGIFMEDILFSARCLKHMKRYMHIPEPLYLYRYNPNGTMASEKAKDYFLDTAVVENVAVDELIDCGRFADCKRELEYMYFAKAFAEPMQRMWENGAFFSYDAYSDLKEQVKKRFPNMGENPYLKATNEEGIKLAFSFYQSDILSAETLWNIMGYDDMK